LVPYARASEWEVVVRVAEPDAPAYLTDHRAACEEIDHLA
jgi:hypothetical protein